MHDWYLLIVMALTAYRLTRLAIKDTLPPVLWARDRLVGGWRPMTAGERAIRAKAPAWPKGVRPYQVQVINDVDNRWITRWSWVPEWLAELLSCPWCVSGWIAGIVTAAADIVIGIADPVFTGFAVWALAALLASREWS